MTGDQQESDECHMVEDGYLSEQFIKQLSGDFDISCVIHIHAKTTGIENLGCVYMCNNLVSLDVSCNRIHDLTPLFKLQSLQILDLSNNLIRHLRGLENMPVLNFLNLCGNEISSMEELKTLETIPTLKKLILRDGTQANPVCHMEGYLERIKGHLPDLLMLDYRYLKGEMSSVFKRLDAIDAQLNEQKVSIHDLPVSKPIVSADFWQEEFYDDLDLNMKLRYLKETVNSVYVEKYRAEEMMKVCDMEAEQAMRRLSAEIKGSSDISPISTSMVELQDQS